MDEHRPVQRNLGSRGGQSEQSVKQHEKKKKGIWKGNFDGQGSGKH